MSEDVGEVEEYVMANGPELALLEKLAAEYNVRVEPLETKALEPLSTATVIVIGVPLAVSTVMRVLDESRGGQVFDLRPDAPRLAYRTRDLMYGLILVRTPDGTVQIERLATRTAFSELVDAVARIVGGDPKEDHDSEAVRARLERQLPAGQARVLAKPQPDDGP